MSSHLSARPSTAGRTSWDVAPERYKASPGSMTRRARAATTQTQHAGVRHRPAVVSHAPANGQSGTLPPRQCQSALRTASGNTAESATPIRPQMLGLFVGHRHGSGHALMEPKFVAPPVQHMHACLDEPTSLWSRASARLHGTTFSVCEAFSHVVANEPDRRCVVTESRIEANGQCPCSPRCAGAP